MKKRIIVIIVTTVLLGVLVWLASFGTRVLLDNNELGVLYWGTKTVAVLAALVILGIALKNMKSEDQDKQ